VCLGETEYVVPQLVEALRYKPKVMGSISVWVIEINLYPANVEKMVSS
jgi:hypothetical protein